MIAMKSKQLLTARYNPKMRLTEHRIYNFAIAKSQANENTFIKKELEELYGVFFRGNELAESIERLSDTTFSIAKDGSNADFVFKEITYNNGTVMFKWNEPIRVHINFD